MLSRSDEEMTQKWIVHPEVWTGMHVIFHLIQITLMPLQWGSDMHNKANAAILMSDNTFSIPHLLVFLVIS